MARSMLTGHTRRGSRAARAQPVDRGQEVPAVLLHHRQQQVAAGVAAEARVLERRQPRQQHAPRLAFVARQRQRALEHVAGGSTPSSSRSCPELPPLSNIVTTACSCSQGLRFRPPSRLGSPVPPPKQPTFSSRSCMCRAFYLVGAGPPQGPARAHSTCVLLFAALGAPRRPHAGGRTSRFLWGVCASRPHERALHRGREPAPWRPGSSLASPCGARAAAWKWSPGRPDRSRVALLPSGWQALSLIAAMAGAALGLVACRRVAGGGDGRAPSPTTTPTSARPLYREQPCSSCPSCPRSPTLAGAHRLAGRSRCWSGSSRLAHARARPWLRSGWPRPFPRRTFPAARSAFALAGAAALRRRRLALRRQPPLPAAATNRSLSRPRAEACGGTTTSEIENNHARGDNVRSCSDCRSAGTIWNAARRRSLESTRRPGDAGGADHCARRADVAVVAFLVCCAAGSGRGPVARGAAAHGLRRDAATLAVGSRRRLSAVRDTSTADRLSENPGRGVRHGRLPDRHDRPRQPRPRPGPCRGLRPVWH